MIRPASRVPRPASKTDHPSEAGRWTLDGGRIREAYAHCRAIAHRYGANFSVGFRFLPRAKRRAVYAAYAFCRYADDIADDGGPDVLGRLDDWERELDLCYDGRPGHVITTALADSLRSFDIPKRSFVALLDGCRQDQIKSRYATFAELLQYCDLVATSISDISLSIFGFRSPAARSHGRDLATALQLTNVIRDVGDDLHRDRVYLPQDELARFGVTERSLRERERNDSVRRLIEFQIERAEEYFRRAEPLLGELDFDARFPTLLMGGIYATVLSRIRQNPVVVLERRLALSPAEKVRVIGARLLRPRFV